MVQADDKEFVQQMIDGENIVQMEDVGLCCEVQKGLTSPAYDIGRWAACICLQINDPHASPACPFYI